MSGDTLWSLCPIAKKASTRCFADAAKLFPIMFFDSEIAKKFQMHKDKLIYVISWVITYGLGPYFQRELAEIIKKCKFYAVSFDESINKIAQKSQMDIVVRFWNDSSEGNSIFRLYFLC